MSDWNNPNTSQVYTDHFKSIRDKDNDLALMFDGVASTNLPIGAIRINSGQGYRLEKWDGTTWNAITAKIGALGTAADKDVGTAASQIPLNSDLGTAANRNVGAAASEVPLNSDLGTAATKNVGTASINVPQNSDLGTAATKNVGTASTNVPQNSDLGTAATKNVGTASDQVPLNSDLGTAATEDSTTFLQKSEFDPANATLVWSGSSTEVLSSSLASTDPGIYLVKTNTFVYTVHIRDFSETSYGSTYALEFGLQKARTRSAAYRSDGGSSRAFRVSETEIDLSSSSVSDTRETITEIYRL